MNCKQGDLAILVSAPAGLEQYIGAVVEVCEFVGTFRPGGIAMIRGELWYSKTGGPAWWVRSKSPSFWDEAGEAPCSDLLLRPLRPDAEPETTDTPNELEAA